MKIFRVILVLLIIVITICFLYFENHLSCSFLGAALFFYILSSAVHLLAHECGHLIGGAVSGYKLLCLQLGPLNIVVNKTNKLTLLWKKSLSGQCVMIPPKTNPIRFIAYNLGGIFANAAVTVLSSALLLSDSFPASLLFIELLCVGIQKILVNAIPHKTDSIPNDGYIVRLLEKNNAVQKDYVMYLSLYGKLFLNEDISRQDYIYERELPANADELLYYNEIQNILNLSTQV